MSAAVPKLKTGGLPVDAFAQAVKQNLDWLTGQQQNAPKLAQLPETASTLDIITLVNKLVQRLDG